jgi:hypothetical protein
MFGLLGKIGLGGEGLYRGSPDLILLNVIVAVAGDQERPKGKQKNVGYKDSRLWLGEKSASDEGLKLLLAQKGTDTFLRDRASKNEKSDQVVLGGFQWEQVRRTDCGCFGELRCGVQGESLFDALLGKSEFGQFGSDSPQKFGGSRGP